MLQIAIQPLHAHSFSSKSQFYLYKRKRFSHTYTTLKGNERFMNSVETRLI